MGFFSWITQDTGRSIYNKYTGSKPFTVYMVDDQDNQYREDDYEGYGVFGGKDYYQLVAEMNMVNPSDWDRQVGIDLEYNPELVKGERKHKEVIYPTLVEKVYSWNNWRNEQPESCPDQGYFYCVEDNENEEEW